MKIAVISKKPTISDAYRLSTKELLTSVGGNTGNLAFIHAVDNQILGEKTYFDWDFDPDFVNERFDFAFLVCANMINPSLNLNQLADRIERLKLPMTAASLGVQGIPEATDFEISASCRRFLFCLSEKSISFGVRGMRAADCLAKLGITNFRIIGCPSNFINPDSHLGSRILESATNSPFINVANHIDLLQAESHNAVCSKLRKLGSGRRSKYFIQAPAGYVDLALKTDRQFNASQMVSLKATFGLQDDQDPLSFVQDTLRCYISIDHWLFDMRNYDCSIGLRLHGNIVAIQAGVPSLIVYHDARTKELAETLSIPHVGIPEFLKADSIESLFHEHLHLMEVFDSQRSNLAREYKEMLEGNGIALSANFLALSQ